MTQLHMLWAPPAPALPPVPVLAPGYELCTFQPGEEAVYLSLMRAAGFDGFDEESVSRWVSYALPDGLFFAVQQSTGEAVATALGAHRPTPLHPFGGELCWVAARPEHTGKRLGMAVCAAATARLLATGHRHVYLKTDDWRLPALVTYLRLGYVPFLYAPDMPARWEAVCRALGWPYTPEDWPASDTAEIPAAAASS